MIQKITRLDDKTTNEVMELLKGRDYEVIEYGKENEPTEVVDDKGWQNYVIGRSTVYAELRTRDYEITIKRVSR